MGGGGEVARAAAAQIANIRQVFLNSGMAAWPFSHSLVLLLVLLVN